MKHLLAFAFFAFFAWNSTAQLLATVELTEPVEGLCDQEHVYSLFDGFQGQMQAQCSLDRGQIEVLLNDNIQFLKDNPKFKGKGMIGVFINCEGEAVLMEIASKSKSDALDQEVLEFFRTFKVWVAGSLNEDPVDCQELFRYEVKKGELTLF